MGRRGESIYRRKDGRWEARYSVGKGLNGMTKYRSVYGRTYSEAKENRRKAMQQAYTPRIEGYFSDVIEHWLSDKEMEVKEQTARKYRQCMKTHIEPYFGKIKTSLITSEMIEGFLSEKRKTVV